VQRHIRLHLLRWLHRLQPQLLDKLRDFFNNLTFTPQHDGRKNVLLLLFLGVFLVVVSSLYAAIDLPLLPNGISIGFEVTAPA
jgi:hypothetical protein